MIKHTQKLKYPVFSPKLFDFIKKGYAPRDLWNDVVAGIVVGIVALPLSIAFAIASGVKPEQGLITAIVAGFLISVFSGSRVQIGGPTGAFIVIVYGIVAKYGYEGLALATVMAGIILILLGVSRLGEVIKYIPYPVTIGFTSGIALIIFTTQVADFFGLKLNHMPEFFWQKWVAYGEHIMHLNPYALVIGTITIFIIVFCPKKLRYIPPPLIALILTTAIVHGFNWPVDTIGSRFGEVSNRFPAPAFPAMSWDLIVKMFPSALTIALLAGIESLLSAVVADGMIGTRHRSNTELIAQGIANIASPIFGGIPATGAIARTATNIKLGGRSPLAGMVHAVTILLIFLFLAPLAALIPMAALAGILIVVAYNMSEWHVFVKLFRSPKSDILVLLATFLLTIFVDLTVAIEVGVVLASFLFMRRMIAVTEVGFISDEEEGKEGPAKPRLPAGVEVFEINGPFFFGAADKFRDTMHQLEKPPVVLILRMRSVPAIDATGLRALEDLLRKAKKDKMAVILSGVQPHPKKVLYQSGVIDGIGKENLCERFEDAIKRAQEIVVRSPKANA